MQFCQWDHILRPCWQFGRLVDEAQVWSTLVKLGRALSIKAEVILAALTRGVKSKMTAVEKILLLLLGAGKWDVNFVLIFVTVKQRDKQPYVILGVLWVKTTDERNFATFKTRDQAMVFEH